MIARANRGQMEAIGEVAPNLLKGNIIVPSSSFKRLKPHKSKLLYLTRKKQKKEELNQKGEFLPAPVQLPALTRLDQDMKQIIESPLREDQKVLMLDQLLQRYQGLTKQMKTESAIKPTVVLQILCLLQRHPAKQMKVHLRKWHSLCCWIPRLIQHANHLINGRREHPWWPGYGTGNDGNIIKLNIIFVIG